MAETTPRVTVTYDQRDKSFSIQDLDSGEILWARNIVLAEQLLRQLGFTDSQSREGTLRAVFNNGNAIQMDNVEKYAAIVSDDPGIKVTPKRLASRIYSLADVINSKEFVTGAQVRTINNVIRELEMCL